MTCLPVLGDTQLESDWIILRTGGQTRYIFFTTYINADLAHHEIFLAKVGNGGIMCLASAIFLV